MARGGPGGRGQAGFDAETRVAFHRGVLSLCGPSVDRAAAAGLAGVPSEWRQKREARDGQGFHVTFLAKGDLQAVAACLRDGGAPWWPEQVERPDADDPASIARAAEAVLAELPGALAWADAGEGRARAGDAEAAFRVVLWPAGQAARRLLGLPRQDFHVTLGFRGHDVHGCGKGLGSLLQGAPAAAAAQHMAATAKSVLDVCSGHAFLSEEAEQLAEAALEAALAAPDDAAEAAALQGLCIACGRARRHEELLAHAASLLQLEPQSELGCRSHATALMALKRYGEALPALRRLSDALAALPEGAERGRLELWLRKSQERCSAELGLPQ